MSKKEDIFDMLHLFTGFDGVVVGAAVWVILWLLACWRTRGKSSFDFDAQGEKAAFEKLLTIYIDILKFVLGLASGSIVLLVGSSAFRTSGHLPPSLASPLFLLALSILYGTLCMGFLITDYEGYRHKTSPYSRSKYIRNQAFGYGSIFCFFVGYLWLIFIVTHPD